MSDLYKDSLPYGSTGQTTVGTTAVQLLNIDKALLTGVLVKASAANSGIVYVGFSGDVTAAKGFPLSAGDSVPVTIDTLDKVWVISDTASQTVAWMAQ